MCVCVCVFDIYIVIHTQIVSLYHNSSRHVGRLKLGSKPNQLYVRLSILPLSQQVTYVSSAIIMHYVVAFVCLHFALPDSRVFNSLEGLCITRVAAVNSFARSLNPRGVYIYIYIYIYIFGLYIYRHYHVTLPARISLALSRHPSQSSIAPWRSSRLYPISSQSCCI